MSEFSVRTLNNSSILFLYTEIETILVDPEYQRKGDIWSLENKQLLIDSVLNGYDIPKFYFHEFTPKKNINGKSYKYAIIDGKQRLSCLFDFIEGKFPLAPDFEFLSDPKIQAGGMTYQDLAEKYPRLKVKFDAYSLAVVCVVTDELDLIEDMFSRLNEASPLNAPEKRNAFSGPIPQKIRDLTQHDFFKKKLRVNDSRYRHQDLATKFLYFEHKNGPVDTKKKYLDNFVKSFTNQHAEAAEALKLKVIENLNKLTSIFTDSDPLLRSVGMVTVYYLLLRVADKKINRIDLDAFDLERGANRLIAEQDIGDADYNLLEFDRFTQSPNDGIAMTFRLSVLAERLQLKIKV